MSPIFPMPASIRKNRSNSRGAGHDDPAPLLMEGRALQKRILCFGDSNTYGYIPGGFGRYDENTRWPMAMARLLGPEYAVVEEGFNGRTLVFDDPVEGGFKSGFDYLPPCLMSHNPLDVVILMLGTNDTKQRFGMNPEAMGQAMSQVARRAKAYAVNAEGKPSRVMIVSPAPILDGLADIRDGGSFGHGAPALSRALAHEYRVVAKLTRCEYFDAAPFAEVSPVDAIHLTAAGHLRLAEAMAEKVKSLC